MSSENFENLEDDFISLRDRIRKRVENDLPKLFGESRKSAFREMQRDLDEAQHVLDELDREAKLAPAPYRLQMVSRLRQYEREISYFKKKSEESSMLSSRSELLSSNRTAVQIPNEASNRTRMLQINQTITRTGERVYHAQQVANETEQVGIAVMDELGTQRETLVRTKERLMDTDANLSRSHKILRAMHRKVITNKLILIIIIVLELAILAGIVYYKFFK